MRHPAHKPFGTHPLGALAAPVAPMAHGGRLRVLWAFLQGGLSTTHRVLLGALLLALLVTALAHPIERALGSAIAERVPGSWVQSASLQAMQRLDEAVLTPSHISPVVQMHIRSQVAALRMPSGEAPLYTLVFRQGNALGAALFTLAGGQIVVTDEFIAQIGSESALMQALTVQMGHLQHRHALRAITDHSPLSMIWYLLGDDALAGAALLDRGQPVIEHDRHCREEAERFAAAVRQANVGVGGQTGRAI